MLCTTDKILCTTDKIPLTMTTRFPGMFALVAMIEKKNLSCNNKKNGYYALLQKRFLWSDWLHDVLKREAATPIVSHSLFKTDDPQANR